MEKERLEKEKETLFCEIIDLRNELKDLNDNINGAYKDIPFWKFFLMPLLGAFIITILFKILGRDTNQLIGLFITLTIIFMAIITFASKSKIKNKKNDLIEQRKSLQREIFIKSKKLSEIENEIKTSFEN